MPRGSGKIEIGGGFSFGTGHEEQRVEKASLAGQAVTAIRIAGFS